ncbi:MAG TPA: fumarylacetoacetate hydrolase family protein [Nevskiaceae bacterium]
MFVVNDHRVSLATESLARDVDASGLRGMLRTQRGFRPPVSGTVYASLLNDRAAQQALEPEMRDAPYKAPPQAPILYVKPRNTLVGYGARVVVPDNAKGVRLGASLGIVIGRVTCCVKAADAMEHVAGFVGVADLSIPHASVYRLPIGDQARDGFCVIGPAVVARRHVANPDALALTMAIEGGASFSGSTSTAVRSAARLLQDVTEFMTLVPGDVLTMGVLHGSPVGHAGDRVTLSVGDWAPLRFELVAADAGAGS